MSASISLLRSRRKFVENCDDSGEESDCSIKDPKKKESIEKDARAIAAINMLTVSMVNQLLEQQGLDPFGKSLGSPSLDEEQSWSTPMRATSRQSVTRSVKENTLTKKSRKSVRFTPDTSRAEFTPERSCDAERLDLTHTRTVSMSALKMEPKFTPLRRSKALKAGMLRSLENEQDISSVDNFACPNDSFDSPLPVRNLALNSSLQAEATDSTPVSSVLEVKSQRSVSEESQQQPEPSTPAPKTAPNEPESLASFSQETPGEGEKEATVSKLNESGVDDASDQNDLMCETPIKPRWTHHFDPTSPEHMSPFLKTLLEERAERGQGKELSKSLSMLEDSEDQKLSILKGVVAFVEVRKADEDRSSGFRWKLKQLGAQVEENFTKKVTHVVFQEGLLSTYRKAKESNVHLVSAVWVMACDESSTRAPEDKYPIDEEDKYSMLAPLKKYIRRPKLMSPNLGDDNDEKRLARRLQAIKRRSMKIEGFSGTDTDANDGAVAHSSKTNPDSKTPQRPKRASLGKKSAATSSGSNFMNAWLAGKKKPDVEKEVDTDVLPVVAELRSSAISTKSPRKRTADGKCSNSPAKLKASFKSVNSPVKDKIGTRSFDSPVKTKSSSRFVDSPVKTKSSSRLVDSPMKTKSSSRFVDSPVKTKSSSRFVDSPVKTESSSRFIDSPVKTKSSSRFVDSPLKTKSSSRFVDSPVKTKSSSRFVDSPLKTKSSSRFVDSPAKTKSSSRSVDSPAKTKSSLRSVDSPSKTLSRSRSVDSPAKTKSSSRSVDSPMKSKSAIRSFDSPLKSKSSSRGFDSPAKAKPSIGSFDSPKKPKLSTKEADSTSSASARPKTSAKAKTPPKRDLAKESRTPVKSFSSRVTSTVTSESTGRALRSTPSKTAGQCSFADVPREEDKTPQEKIVSKSSGKVSITSWLSANKASFTAPVKRSLSGTLKGVTSNPARRSKASASSKTKDGTKDEPVLETVAEVDLKSPEFFEAPRKKARMSSTPQKKSTGKVGTQSSSGSGKQLKSASGGPSQSKDSKKKVSPRGKAGMKNKSNDKSQTVLTSHFRVVSSPKEDAKVKVVSEQPCSDVSEHEAVLAPSSEEDRTVETSALESGDETNVAMHCDTPVVESGDIDCEMPLACPSMGETENFVPVTVDAQEEPLTHEPADPQCADIVTEEQQLGAGHCGEPAVIEGVCEEQATASDSSEQVEVSELPSAIEAGEEQTTAYEEPTTTSDTPEKPPATEEKASGTFEEPRIGEDISDQQLTSAYAPEERTLTSAVSDQPSVLAESLEERSATTLVSEEQPIWADSVEEGSATPLVSKQQPICADSVEEGSATPLVSDEQPMCDDSVEEEHATPLVSEEQPICADSVEEEHATPLVSEEQPICADSVEEGSATPLVSEEQPICADSVEERSATPLVSEEQPICADPVEEKSATPLVSEEQPICADSVKRSATPVVSEEQPICADSVERLATPLVSEEQPICADPVEERSATPLVSEEQPICADSVERSATPLVSDEQPIPTDSVEERAATPVMNEEQQTWANLSEERSATPAVSDEQTAFANSIEEPGRSLDSVEERAATPVMNEEQQTWANLSEERSATPAVSDEQTASANSIEEPGRSLDSVEEQPLRTLSNLSEERPNVTNELPDNSSGSVPRDGSSDSFSSLSSGNSSESSRKRARKSIKPVNKQSQYRTRRSTRFVTSDVTD